MRTILLLLPFILLMAAEAEPKPLDPSKPEDAIQIIHILTQDVSMPRKNADTFRDALVTLAKLVQESKKPVEPAKPKE